MNRIALFVKSDNQAALDDFLDHAMIILDEGDYARKMKYELVQDYFDQDTGETEGHEHVWPAELASDAQCEVCGLPYGQWAWE